MAAAPGRFVTKSYRGYYRRFKDEPQFQPCGTRAPLDVVGSYTAVTTLKERFRWNATWEGRKMFAQFQGEVVHDSMQVVDSTTGNQTWVPRSRFYVVDVESLRTWMSSDCGGMRIP